MIDGPLDRLRPAGLDCQFIKVLDFVDLLVYSHYYICFIGGFKRASRRNRIL